MDRVEDPLDRSSQASFATWDLPLPDTLPISIIHLQTLEEKRGIFGRMEAAMRSEREHGEAILSRLRTLSPQTAELFEVKTHQIDNFTMRLVNNRPDESVPEESYVALSYCWPQAYSRPNESEFTIPTSEVLFQAAMAERAAFNEGLWVDQMCIDQDSDEEKSISIPIMSVLYRNAARVVVILDDVIMTEEEMLFLGRDLLPAYQNPAIPSGQFPHLRDPLPYMVANPVLYHFFAKICESKWFTRAWCAHEMRLAQWHRFYIKCPIVFPGKTMAFGFTGQFMWWLAALSSSLPATSEAMRKARMTIVQTLDLKQRIRQTIRLHRGEYSSESNDNTYTLTMREVFMLGAGGNPKLPNPTIRDRDANRDKMSIVLNLLGNGLKLRGSTDPELEEYSSMDKCFRDLLVLGIAAGDATALCTTGESLGTGDESLSATWLCRPETTDLGSAPETEKLPEFDTSGIEMDSSPVNCWVKLDGYFLSTTDTPTEDANEIITAEILIELAIQLEMGLSPTGGVNDGFGPGPNYGAWQFQTTTPEKLRCFTKTLACVLYLGHEWLAHTATRCSFPPSYLDELISNSKIHQSGFSLPALMEASGEQAQSMWEGVSAILRFTNWLMAWGHNTTTGSREAWSPYIFKNGQNKILTFAKKYDGGPFLFFPACLRNDAYVRLARAWVLQPISVGTNHLLIMRGKTRIFTPVSLEDLWDSGWVYAPEKTIYGW